MIKYNYGPVDKSKKSAEPRIVLGNSESCSYWYSSPGTFLNAVYPTKNINKKYSKQKIMFFRKVFAARNCKTSFGDGTILAQYFIASAS